MTEQQAFDVVRDYGSFELRRYPEHLLAEVIVDGPFDSAGNRAFRHLFSYITGANIADQKIEMTAPVLQAEVDPAVLVETMTPHTIDNIAGNDGRGQYRVAFVLPEAFTVTTAPLPTDPMVQLRAVPEAVVAALRFSGRWSEKRYQEQLEQLQTNLVTAGLTAAGKPKSARFDPPFMPWFLRHNEVLQDVATPVAT